MPKIPYSGCVGLSPAISSQFIFEKCAAAKNCKKIHSTPFLWGEFKVVQSHRCWQI